MHINVNRSPPEYHDGMLCERGWSLRKAPAHFSTAAARLIRFVRTDDYREPGGKHAIIVEGSVRIRSFHWQLPIQQLANKRHSSTIFHQHHKFQIPSLRDGRTPARWRNAKFTHAVKLNQASSFSTKCYNRN